MSDPRPRGSEVKGLLVGSEMWERTGEYFSAATLPRRPPPLRSPKVFANSDKQINQTLDSTTRGEKERD